MDKPDSDPMGDGQRYNESCPYMMSGTRKALLINIETFEPRLNLTPRTATRETENDADTVESRLRELGFVIEKVPDPTVTELDKKISELKTSQDYQDADCFACVIFSYHGRGESGESGEREISQLRSKSFYCKDGSIEIRELLSKFTADKFGALKNKPKLFFIQTFQSLKDISDNPETPETKPCRIPCQADFMLVESVVEESPMNYKSLFVEALSKVIAQEGVKENVDVLKMMTMINKKFTDLYPEKNKKERIPCVTSTLRKDLYFLNSRGRLDLQEK